MQTADEADRAMILARDHYWASMTNFQNVLDAKRPLLAFQDQLAASDETGTSNLVRLCKALGGG